MADSPIPETEPCTCHVPCTCGSQADLMASLKAALEEAERRNGELRAEVKGKTSKITQLSQLARKWERKHSHRENWIRALRGDRADLKVRLRAAEGERDAAVVALKRENVAQAMQDAWNEFCADTGCIPDAFTIAGPSTTRVYADFGKGNFAQFVADRLAALNGEDGK